MNTMQAAMLSSKKEFISYCMFLKYKYPPSENVQSINSSYEKQKSKKQHWQHDSLSEYNMIKWCSQNNHKHLCVVTKGASHRPFQEMYFWIPHAWV